MGRTFDSIIIGSGQTGPFLAARRLAAAGLTVALVERKFLGGDEAIHWVLDVIDADKPSPPNK